VLGGFLVSGIAANRLGTGPEGASAQEGVNPSAEETRVALNLTQSNKPSSSEAVSKNRPPSAAECAEIARTFQATTAAIVAHLASGDDSTRDALDAEVARSRAWVDAGCPAHPVYGIYDAPDGSFAEVRILDPERLTP
jgi:hypothetical protein